MIAANTIHAGPDEQKVTYHEPNVPPMAPHNAQCFLDVGLATAAYQVYRKWCAFGPIGLLSYHFPVVATITDTGAHDKKVARPVMVDWATLRAI